MLTAWCRTNLGWTNQYANRILRIGRRLRDLPVTRDAWESGTLSEGQVDIIVANVTDARAALWSEHEAEVVPKLVPLDVLQTSRAMQHWAKMADATNDGPEPPEEPPAEAMLVRTIDGRSYLKGSFDGEHGEVLATPCGWRTPVTTRSRCPSGRARRWSTSPAGSSTTEREARRSPPPTPQRGREP